MFGLTLVDKDQNRIELSIGTSAVMKFERDGGNYANLQSEDGMIALKTSYTLAHIAAVRKGIFKGSLEEFEDTYDIDLAVEEGDPDLDITNQEA